MFTNGINGAQCWNDIEVYRLWKTAHVAKKLNNSEKSQPKRFLNDFQYVCGTILQDIPDDERNKDFKLVERVFRRENIACINSTELPYFACQIFREICIY